MTFTEWYQLQSIDIREDLDVWSAQQGWNAAINQLRLDIESLDLLRKMSPLPQHTEEESKIEWVDSNDYAPGDENEARHCFPWMSEQMELRKEKNFFETRVTEYQSGGALSFEGDEDEWQLNM